MLKRIVLITIGLLFVMSLGCQNLLDQGAAKARDLGQVVETNMKTSDEFRNYIVTFQWDNVPGVYRCVTQGIPDAATAGRFAYNAMVVLDERNNTLVKIGRSDFTIIGEQDGTQIFEAHLTAGSNPTVALKGPWANETWVPNAEGR